MQKKLRKKKVFQNAECKYLERKTQSQKRVVTMCKKGLIYSKPKKHILEHPLSKLVKSFHV